MLIGLLPSVALVLGLVGTCLAGLIDRGQDMADASRYPLRHGPIRIELHIDRLDTNGKSHTGLPCDITDKCDPKVIAFIDTEKPNHDFGGDSVPYANYITLFDGNNIDIPQIDKTITRDICGKSSVREAERLRASFWGTCSGCDKGGLRLLPGDRSKVALRVRAIDKDTVNDDKIDNYKCFITGDQIPADNDQVAEWSAEVACPGEDRKNSKVYMKYRWYNIPESECRPSSNGRTFFSGMFS